MGNQCIELFAKFGETLLGRSSILKAKEVTVQVSNFQVSEAISVSKLIKVSSKHVTQSIEVHIGASHVLEQINVQELGALFISKQRI